MAVPLGPVVLNQKPCCRFENGSFGYLATTGEARSGTDPKPVYPTFSSNSRGGKVFFEFRSYVWLQSLPKGKTFITFAFLNGVTLLFQLETIISMKTSTCTIGEDYFRR